MTHGREIPAFCARHVPHTVRAAPAAANASIDSSKNARTCPTGDEILDLGCGTGTLTIQIARAFPGVMVTGIDADPEALAIARAKAVREVTPLTFMRGFAQHLPFDNGRFDTVVSSLFFHHLTRTEKKSALAETRRVLKPGGALHVADWGKPANLLMHAGFLAVRLLDGFETTAESVGDGLLELMRAAGFEGVSKTAVINTPLGTIGIYRGNLSWRNAPVKNVNKSSGVNRGCAQP